MSCDRLILERQGEANMIGHTGIGTADAARSEAFYNAVLKALGLHRVIQLPAATGADAVVYGEDYPVFRIDRFHPHGIKRHTTFAANNRAAVDTFHAAALKAGGTDNGPPRLHATDRVYPPGYYAAFALDPDGNNSEAVHRES